MSYTSLYAVYKTKAVNVEEFHNGSGSGPAIWDYISIKHDGNKMPMFGKNLDYFWDLWKDSKYDRDEKAVFMSTFDNALIEIDHLEEFSKACLKIHDNIIKHTEWQWNHFSDIGETALFLHRNHDHRCIGLGIGCTSVCDPWECWKPKEKECWGVYAEIDSLKTEKKC